MSSIEEKLAQLKMSAGEEPIIYQASAKKAPQVPPKPNKKQEQSKTPLVIFFFGISYLSLYLKVKLIN